MDSENATINFSPSGGSNQQPSAWPSNKEAHMINKRANTILKTKKETHK